MKRLLILGGTGEAAALHEAGGERFETGLEIVSSLAGRTTEPRSLPGTVRTGGFGGAEGLARWLREEDIDMVVDATHPYAVRISANARAACETLGVDRIILWRPPWTAQPGDDWIPVADAAEAAELLPSVGKRAFLALGSGQLRQFADVKGVWLMSRVAETPEPHTAPTGFERVGIDRAHDQSRESARHIEARADSPGWRIAEGDSTQPGSGLVVVDRGPFSADEELRLMEEHDIDLLVSRNSGGDATVGKITAARRRGIPVIMLERPAPEPGEQCTNLKEILQWLARNLV